MKNIKKKLDVAKTNRENYLITFLNTIFEISRSHDWREVSLNVDDGRDDPTKPRNYKEIEEMVKIKLTLTVTRKKKKLSK